MDNRIIRYYEDDNIRIYYRCGYAKIFAPLQRYFVYDIKQDTATGKEFKSVTQVRNYIKTLNTGILL